MNKPSKVGLLLQALHTNLTAYAKMRKAMAFLLAGLKIIVKLPEDKREKLLASLLQSFEKFDFALIEGEKAMTAVAEQIEKMEPINYSEN